MDRRQAEAEIHKIAASDSGQVFLLVHAKRRKPDIGKYPLTKAEIVSVLEAGRISEGPSPDLVVKDGWKFTMTRTSDGHTYCVAGVLVPETEILVITGYEDRSKRPARAPRLPGGIGGDERDTE